MSLKFKLLAVAILINLALPNTGLADRRNFLWSYEAKTMAKGETELEQYFTTDVDKSETDTNYRLTHEHQIEVEYGITDNFDVGIYQIFRQREGEGFSYRGYKTRGRYRFGEMGQYFFDPLIYLEFTHKPTGHEVEFEEKIVLAKSIERLRLAFNMSFEQELKYKTNETLHILEPSFASGIQITRWFLAGIEMVGSWRIDSPGGFHHGAFFAGPTLSFVGQTLWFDMGALFQLSDAYNHQPRYRIRTLLGLHF